MTFYFDAIPPLLHLILNYKLLEDIDIILFLLIVFNLALTKLFICTMKPNLWSWDKFYNISDEYLIINIKFL